MTTSENKPNAIRRCLRGSFTPPLLYRYLLVFTLGFWGLIFLAWLGYPTENTYSIWTHTFSFLGSFESKHSPTWWWLFTLAMLVWSLGALPLIGYMHRHFRRISKPGARVGTFLLWLGAVSIGLVGLIPDVRVRLTPNLRVGHVHARVALGVAVGFIAGFFTYGVLLLKDRFSRSPRFVRHRLFLGPYVLWLSVVGVSSFFLIRWEFVYARMKEEAAATGERIGGSWSEALGTIYAFPLWENILIYVLFISILWITLALSHSERGSE